MPHTMPHCRCPCSQPSLVITLEHARLPAGVAGCARRGTSNKRYLLISKISLNQVGVICLSAWVQHGRLAGAWKARKPACLIVGNGKSAMGKASFSLSPSSRQLYRHGFGFYLYLLRPSVGTRAAKNFSFVSPRIVLYTCVRGKFVPRFQYHVILQLRESGRFCQRGAFVAVVLWTAIWPFAAPQRAHPEPK